MKSHSRIVVLAFATVGQFAAVSVRAQAADSLTKAKANGSIAPEPIDTSVHKKHGMFGKLKGLAQNKTVQTIGKAAICQAVPGGQYMMGAAEAAKNKTSIASGVANSSSCIPGLPGGGGIGGIGGGKGALAGAAVGAASSIGAGARPGQGAAGMAGALAGRMKMPGGGNGVTGAVTANATAQSLAAMQTAMSRMNTGAPAVAGAGAAAGAPAAADAGTEASGEQMKLSGDVNEEIKKGKLTIKKIDWVHGTAQVSAPSTEGFMTLMQSAGQAMKAAGGTYRVDVYTDKKYTDQEISTLGMQRQLALMSLLQAGGASEGMATAGKLGKDKEQRVEIVKVK